MSLIPAAPPRSTVDRTHIAPLLCLLWADVLPAQVAAPLADAVEKRDATAVARLLEQKADVNAHQVDGMTALHWAVYQDDLPTARVLIRAGAKVKAKNRYGVAPPVSRVHQWQRPAGRAVARAGCRPQLDAPWW